VGRLWEELRERSWQHFLVSELMLYDCVNETYKRVWNKRGVLIRGSALPWGKQPETKRKEGVNVDLLNSYHLVVLNIGTWQWFVLDFHPLWITKKLETQYKLLSFESPNMSCEVAFIILLFPWVGHTKRNLMWRVLMAYSELPLRTALSVNLQLPAKDRFKLTFQENTRFV